MWESLKNKTILFTIKNTQNYAGSEINCLELSSFFMEKGADVTVATYNCAEPMRSEFVRKGIKVVNVFFDEIKNKHFDLIWANHSAVLNYILFNLGITANKIVYSSLSPFEPSEVIPPYVNRLSLCLANSEETKQQLITEGADENNVYVFPNFVNNEMIHFSRSLSRPEKLKNIAIVSNHVSESIEQLVDLSNSKGYCVTIYGVGHLIKRIDADEIKQYDLIITIGKTVQYCMSLGIPVYCYDVFGGPGYLKSENIDRAFFYNFSGRGGFGTKTPEELFDDIVNGYAENLNDLDYLKQFVEKNCSLESNCHKVLEKISSGENVDIASILSSYRYIKRENDQYVNEYRYNLSRLIENINLHNAISNDKTIIDRQNKELEQKEANCEYLLEVINEKENEISSIKNGRCWKMCEFLLLTKQRIIKVMKNPLIVLYKLFPSIKERKIKKVHIKEASNKELVSIIIPVYDRTDVLKESIESVLNQTYDNIEVILVCDGSPKETIDIVDSYNNNPKVRIFKYFDNSGNAVRGRNKGIREAKGKYIAFQDSDDVAVPERISISLDYMKAYNADVVYGGWRAIVDGSRDIDIQNGQEVYSPDCDYEMLKELCVPCQSTVMVKRDALLDVGGLKTTMRYREDHELWLRLAYFGYKFKSVDKILTNLRLHKNNLELAFKDDDNRWLSETLKEHTKKEKFKPKVAYVIPGCGISGGIAVICQHANRLLKRGFDVLMISGNEDTKIDWFPGLLVEVLPLSKCPDNIDIVVATGWQTAYMIDKINAKRKFYFVQSDETRFNPVGSPDYKKAYKTYLMDYEFLTEALWIKKWLKDKFSKDATYVPNGLDEEIIYQTAPLVNKPDSKLRILLEGPIDIPYKGMEDAFKAVENLDCEVWCISSAGKPKPEWKCDRLFEKVPMKEMKYIYSSCDLFLKMSRVEGFFGPPLEMMACGGACVVGKVTGYDEYIKDGYNALVVEQGDVEGAHNALKRLISDENLRKRLIENGKKTAQEYRWEPTIDTLEKVFLQDN